MSKRTYDLRVKLTEEEMQKLRSDADKMGLTMSSFARLLILHRKIEPTSI